MVVLWCNNIVMKKHIVVFNRVFDENLITVDNMLQNMAKIL